MREDVAVENVRLLETQLLIARAQIVELTREQAEAIEEAAKAVAAYHNLYETWTESRARHLEAEAERDALRERLEEYEDSKR